MIELVFSHEEYFVPDKKTRVKSKEIRQCHKYKTVTTMVNCSIFGDIEIVIIFTTLF